MTRERHARSRVGTLAPMADLLITRARIVEQHSSPGAPGPTDVRVADGVVTEIAPGGALAPMRGERVLEADGRWLIPGLWDQHVHMTTWAAFADRLDLTGTTSPAEVLQRVVPAIAALEAAGVEPDRVLIGMGYRASLWVEPASVAALDEVTGSRPVILISGDAHNGWMNTAALRALGLPDRTGILDENDWFPVITRLAELPEGTRTELDQVRRAMAGAAARGVVGITDFEFASSHRVWPSRVAAGLDGLRVRAGFYEEALDEVLRSGARTGDTLAGPVTLGPLKIISDGSLGTLTAHCCEPYAPSPGFPRGKRNVSPTHLEHLLATANAAGLEVALHAIGDRAVSDALSAFAATGATGSIEHVQLMRRADIGRMAELGVRASVQPAHLLDDRVVTDRIWADRADRAFMLRSLTAAGVPLALGSDAPVSPLDPWLAIDAAVWRAEDGDEPWFPEERITPAQALFASTDGAGPVRTGALGDLVLLDDDPLRTRPRHMRVGATIVGGAPVFAAFDSSR